MFLLTVPWLFCFSHYVSSNTLTFGDYEMVKYISYLVAKITLLPWLFRNLLQSEIKNSCYFFLVLQILLFISGSVEINRGPADTKMKHPSFAVWNLDSLPAREFPRTPLIETLQSSYDFDVFGVSESMLSDKHTNEDIHIHGFSPDPFRNDKATDTRNGGVCLYFKESLPIKRRRDLEKLPETIVAEIKFKKKIKINCSIISSPQYGQ